MPPSLRSRQRRSIAPAQHRISKPAHSSSRKRNMVSTRSQSSRRKAAAASASSAAGGGRGGGGIRSPSSTSSHGSSASNTTIRTFPELVRSRVAYSPSPSIASAEVTATITPRDILAAHYRPHHQTQRQHLLWPSQLHSHSASSSATAAPFLLLHDQGKRAASSASSAGSPEPAVAAAAFTSIGQARAGERFPMRGDEALDVYRETLESALRKGGGRR